MLLIDCPGLYGRSELGGLGKGNVRQQKFYHSKKGHPKRSAPSKAAGSMVRSQGPCAGPKPSIKACKSHRSPSTGASLNA
jgi:hypothetical protein